MPTTPAKLGQTQSTTYRFPDNGKNTICSVTVDGGGGIRVNSGDTLARYSCAIHNGSPLFANEFGIYDRKLNNIVPLDPMVALTPGTVVIHLPSLQKDAWDRMKIKPKPIPDDTKRKLIEKLLINDFKITKNSAWYIALGLDITHGARVGIFMLDLAGVIGVGQTGGFVGGAGVTGGMGAMVGSMAFIAGGVLAIGAFFVGSYFRIIKAVTVGYQATQAIAFTYGYTAEIFDRNYPIQYPRRLLRAVSGKRGQSNSRFHYARSQALKEYRKSWKKGFQEGQQAAKKSQAKAAATYKIAPDSFKLMMKVSFNNNPKQLCKYLLLKMAQDSNKYSVSYLGGRLKAEGDDCRYPH